MHTHLPFLEISLFIGQPFTSLLPMAEEALRASGSTFTQLPSRHQHCPFSDFLREAKHIGPAPFQLKELRGAQGRST